MATANFHYRNRCVVVTNEDYEIGNTPDIGDYVKESLRSYTSHYLMRGTFFDIVLTNGYYEHGCIDYVRNDSSFYDVTGIEDNYALLYELHADLHRYAAHLFKNRAVIDKVFKTVPRVYNDHNPERKAERMTAILEKLEELAIEHEERRINQLIDNIKRQYNYTEYVCTARASNGEAFYEKVKEVS